MTAPPTASPRRRPASRPAREPGSALIACGHLDGHLAAAPAAAEPPTRSARSRRPGRSGCRPAAGGGQRARPADGHDRDAGARRAVHERSRQRGDRRPERACRGPPLGDAQPAAALRAASAASSGLLPTPTKPWRTPLTGPSAVVSAGQGTCAPARPAAAPSHGASGSLRAGGGSSVSQLNGSSPLLQPDAEHCRTSARHAPGCPSDGESVIGTRARASASTSAGRRRRAARTRRVHLRVRIRDVDPQRRLPLPGRRRRPRRGSRSG